MKLIKPYFEILEQKPRNIVIPDDMEIGPKMIKQELIDTIYRQIEIAGRTCYKSEDKITDKSAKIFVDRLVKSKHTAVLEHGTVYLDIMNFDDVILAREFYFNNPYSKISKNIVEDIWEDSHLYVTTNYRVLVENNRLSDLKYLCEPTKYHEKRVTVRFICDRGILAEFTRHRTFSFCAESTRYCNYSKNKFGNELTFIIPNWVNTKCSNKEQDEPSFNDIMWSDACKKAEDYYLSLLKGGWKPQEARTVLPNALKTELIMTGFVNDWKHFFELRCPESAHPQARELAEPLHAEFIKLGMIAEKLEKNE